MRLFGDGKHGHAERIGDLSLSGLSYHFHFQARHALVSSENPFPCRVAVVLSALAEGLDPSAAERVFGYRQTTITTWLSRAGSHAQTLHERFFCHLWLPYLQLDELRTRLRCAKQVRLALAGHRPLYARFFPSSVSAPARRTWRTCSSIPCDSSWPLAVFRS
jgi:hypothetical protein